VTFALTIYRKDSMASACAPLIDWCSWMSREGNPRSRAVMAVFDRMIRRGRSATTAVIVITWMASWALYIALLLMRR
jgi:hypothetical protein